MIGDITAGQRQCFGNAQASTVQQGEQGYIAIGDPRRVADRADFLHHILGVAGRQRARHRARDLGRAQGRQTRIVHQAALVEETEEAAHHRQCAGGRTSGKPALAPVG
jgi:hypothetical protein